MSKKEFIKTLKSMYTNYLMCIKSPYRYLAEDRMKEIEKEFKEFPKYELTINDLK